MKSRLPSYFGISLGVIYGLSVRSIFEVLSPFGLGLVSVSFFFFVPFVIGYLRVHFELGVRSELSPFQSIFISWQPIFAFLLVTFITVLEGSICIVMAMPAFMLFAGFGGLLARLNQRIIRSRNTAISLAFVPLLLSPIEAQLPQMQAVYEIRNSVLINASPSVVWHQLGNVSNISEDEIEMNITGLIGIPRPIEAQMNGAGVGSIRTSVWEKGVVFQEVITAWEPGKLMAYEFLIDPDLIPDTALDKHVKMGGEYFSPLRGKYELTSTDGVHTTLVLSTVIRDNTLFGIYSRLWGEIIFRDFHNSILNIMKTRSENRS